MLAYKTVFELPTDALWAADISLTREVLEVARAIQPEPTKGGWLREETVGADVYGML